MPAECRYFVEGIRVQAGTLALCSQSGIEELCCPRMTKPLFKKDWPFCDLESDEELH